ncbi:MAG: T9SS type A sorting domain-containing protein [Bacteroidota bacterium]
MKSLLMIICCWVGSFVSNAQYVAWSDPEAITDSLHYNRNICFPLGWDMSYDSLFVVWEIADDTLSTAIWCRNLKGSGAPFPLLQTSGVHYRNPKIYQVPSGDTLFFLYYETNASGNWDINYVGYLGNGAVSTSIAVFATAADETSFSWVSFYGALWQRNSTILFRKFNIPGGFITGYTEEVLDQGNCRNPVYYGQLAAWEKPVGDDVQIWFCSYDYQTQHYDPPVQVADTGMNVNLFMGSGMAAPDLLWQTMQDGFWRIKGSYLPTLEPLDVIDFPGTNNIQPAFADVPIGVAASGYFFPSMFTFASDSTGNYEIFAFEDFWDPLYVNLSGYPNDDLHPQLFEVWNYEYGHGNLILCWESNRNNNWQIWMRNMDIYLGSQEMNAGRVGAEVIAVPNPFDFSTMLEFRTDKQGSYQAEIFSQQGTLAWSSSGEIPHPGIQRIAWDGRTNAGTNLPAGIYMVRIHTDHQVFHGRVIHQ